MTVTLPSDLGNSMPLAMANVLCLPIVIMTPMENLPVLPITPRGMYSMHANIHCL